MSRRDRGGDRPGDWPLENKVYVGGLPSDASAGELEDVFSRYGKLKKVWIARRPPGFAFLEYEDTRDAEDAVRALDGTRICGARARVEMSNGKRRSRGSPRGDRGGGYSGGRDYDRDRRRTPPVRRRSYSRSRSRSPRRSRSRSPARRSDSRSPPPRRERSFSRSRSRS